MFLEMRIRGLQERGLFKSVYSLDEPSFSPNLRFTGNVRNYKRHRPFHKVLLHYSGSQSIDNKVPLHANVQRSTHHLALTGDVARLSRCTTSGVQWRPFRVPYGILHLMRSYRRFRMWLSNSPPS